MGGISVVLTDMHSETSKGLELARYTKAQWPDVALIVTSGWLLPFPGLLPEGAVFLAKPFGQKRLAAILAEAAQSGGYRLAKVSAAPMLAAWIAKNKPSFTITRRIPPPEENLEP